jgi:spore coat protein U-like protein
MTTLSESPLIVKRLLPILVIFLCWQTDPAKAAISCSVTASGLAFGDVTSALLANQTSSTTGTISFNCTGFTANSTATVCLSLDTYNSSNTRSMTSGSNTLNYQIYQNSSYTTRWGDRADGFVVTAFVSTNSSGAASGSATMYAQVLTGQTTLPAGSYSQSIVGGSNNELAAANGTSTPCTSITSNTKGISFTTTATISNLCNISASNLDFGSVANLSTSVAGTSSITLQCTNGDAYNVGLNAGSGGGATITNRLMTNGSYTVTYSLYQNNAHSAVWGNTIGTNTVSGTGSGGSQILTVYGLVPVQTAPAAGTYNDTVIATVTY